MRLIGCDLHARQQSIAMLDCDTGVVVEKTLKHEGGTVREFYASILAPVVVGIEATGSMGWFLRLMEELAIECRVGHPTAIRKAETRRQKHDRRDAALALLLQLLAEDRFPAIWMPSIELRDLRALLLQRHQWVRMRTRVQNALHAIAMAHGVRRGHTLWNREGQALLASFRCRRIRRIAAASCRRCISTSRNTSIDWTNGCSTSPTSVLERRCS
jgi:transposase